MELAASIEDSCILVQDPGCEFPKIRKILPTSGILPYTRRLGRALFEKQKEFSNSSKVWKCQTLAFKQVLPQALEHLPPAQVGVGVRDAVSHVANAVRCAHQTCMVDAESGILQIDVSNAFNSISRPEILRNVWDAYPQIGKWVEFSLCHAGILLTETSTIKSTNGV